MLVYAKLDENNKPVLYGTLGNIPASTDQPLIYKDRDGNVLTLENGDLYFDGGHGDIKRKYDGKFVDCYIGDKKIIPAI